MKLRNIHIDPYKNLNSNFSFENNTGYVSLIGLNGSGKSNLLEAISLLFAHVMGIEVIFPFNQYSITYNIREHGVDINEGDSLENGSITEDDLPSSLIACYSGEDNRLWDSGFNSYYIDFFNKAIGGGEYKPKILYINKLCWKIAFLSLLFSEDDEVKSFITDKLHIDIESVNVQFITKEDANPQAHDASNWYNRVRSKYAEARIQINDLKNDEDVDLGCRQYPELTPDQVIFYYLYFLHMPNKNSKPALNADRVIEAIDISVNGFNFDNLSEGEKKLILIECITRVLGDENSLVLLDEPDAHIHIAMKKDLLELISKFKGQTIMTTHSPMFLNKRWDGYKEENIFYMHDGKIEDTEPLKHLAELTDNSIDYFEGSFILSSKKILVTEGPYDILYIKHAIDKFSDENPNYLKIKEQVAFMHAGGANNAKALYEQTISPILSKTENIVFVFDYDKEGFVGLTQLRGSISVNHDTKTKCIFYQTNYDYDWLDKPQSINSYMAEDLFDSNSYASVVEALHIIHTHKEFRNRTQATSDAIKEHIKSSYSSFEKEWLQNFKPVLNKLLDIFDLN